MSSQLPKVKAFSKTNWRKQIALLVEDDGYTNTADNFVPENFVSDLTVGHFNLGMEIHDDNTDRNVLHLFVKRVVSSKERYSFLYRRQLPERDWWTGKHCFYQEYVLVYVLYVLVC